MDYAITSKVKKIIFIVITVVVFAFILFPPVMLFLTSIKTEMDALSFPPKWIFTPTSNNYTDIFHTSPFFKYIRNSVIVAAMNTAASIGLGSLAAYSLARFKFRGSDNLAFWILSIRMMPPVAAIIPLYIIMKNLHLLDTPWCLVVVYLTFNLPFGGWMMKGFFEDVPREIEEGALIDGCSDFEVFRKVALPLAAPGLAATAILVFIFSWNEFLFALILTYKKATPVTVLIAGVEHTQGVQFWFIATRLLSAILPPAILALAAQRYIVRGLTFGAVKG